MRFDNNKKKMFKTKEHSEYNEYNTKNIDHITMNSALRVNKKYILLNRLTLKKKKRLTLSSISLTYVCVKDVR